MQDIQAKLEETVRGLAGYLKGTKMLKKLLVFVVALTGAYLAYKFLRDNLSKLLEG